MQLCKDARNAMQAKGAKIPSHFKVSALPPRDKALYDILRYIFMTSTPVCHVENREFRRVCRHEIAVVRKTVNDVIFKLAELVERRIAKELRGTTGAIMYDGWSKNSVHYVAIYASYCADVLQRSDNRDMVRTISRLTPLGISPLGSGSVNDDGEENEATTFDAEAYFRYFKAVSFYGLDLGTWTRCFIADNCAVNLQIALL